MTSWPLWSMEDFIFYITMCKDIKSCIKFFWLWLERLALAPARLWITLYHPFTPSTTIISLPRIVVIWLPPFIISAFYLASFPKPKRIIICCIMQQKGQGQASGQRLSLLLSSPPIPSPDSKYTETRSDSKHSDLPKISTKCQRNKRFLVQQNPPFCSSRILQQNGMNGDKRGQARASKA